MLANGGDVSYNYLLKSTYDNIPMNMHLWKGGLKCKHHKALENDLRLGDTDTCEGPNLKAFYFNLFNKSAGSEFTRSETNQKRNRKERAREEGGEHITTDMLQSGNGLWL